MSVESEPADVVCTPSDPIHDLKKEFFVENKMLFISLLLRIIIGATSKL
jgi:hypothetical protein